MPRCCFDRRLDDGLSMLSRRFDPRKMFRLEGIWVETEFRALPGTLGGNSLQTASTIESILDDRGIGLLVLSRLCKTE